MPQQLVPTAIKATKKRSNRIDVARYLIPTKTIIPYQCFHLRHWRILIYTVRQVKQTKNENIFLYVGIIKYSIELITASKQNECHNVQD